MAKTNAARYMVKTKQYFGIGRKSSTPHSVIDNQTNETVEEYKSKRAAQMHASHLNREAKSEAAR